MYYISLKRLQESQKDSPEMQIKSDTAALFDADTMIYQTKSLQSPPTDSRLKKFIATAVFSPFFLPIASLAEDGVDTVSS